MPAGRAARRRLRVGPPLLLALLAGGLGLAAVPDGPGSVRAGGVAFGWWYGAVAAPLASAAVAVLGGGRPGGALLAGWLLPSLWLAVPVLDLESGQSGVWLGLLLVAGPLLAGWRSRAAAAPGADDAAGGAVLLLAAGLLLAANLALAGALAERLGLARASGVLVAALAAAALLPWRRSARTAAMLLAVALGALGLATLALARVAGAGPLAVWVAVADRPGPSFRALSPWITAGGDLGRARGRQPLVFEEEHRVVATAPATLRVLSQDGLRVVQRDWPLAAGQALVLRPGDRLEPTPGAIVRFEVGKRVPGAPAGAGALTGAADWPALAGLALTVLAGALALVPARAAEGGGRAWRPATALLGALAWAHAWGLYTAHTAPEVHLGGVSADRLLEAPWQALAGRPAASAAGVLAATGALAAFLAGSLALRRRLALAGPPGAGPGWERSLWAGVLALAAVAALRPLDPAGLSLGALGLAGSALGPVALWPGPLARGRRRLACLTGAVAFGALALAGGAAGSLIPAAPAVLAYPTLVAAPLSGLVLWLGGRLVPAWREPRG